MALTITRTETRRTLLASTQVPVNAAKSVTGITRSGTTATATSTSHGYSNGDYVIIQGADRPPYNGVFKVGNVATNTFDYTMESDPGATAAGTITAQKGIIAQPWGDGSTVDGQVSVGSTLTTLGGDLVVNVATTTAPTTACRVSVYRSSTGAAGTWKFYQSVDATTAANDMSTHVVEVPRGQFVLVFFWRVAGTAVYVDAVAFEDTNFNTSP